MIVADDGSADETREVFSRHADAAKIPIHFVTHPRRGFELARCRNQGMQATQAPYLVFLDGDCVAPPDFLTRHLQLRQKRTVVAGFTCHLDQETSAWLDETTIGEGKHHGWAHRRRFAN